jgi:hypothetical protein
MDRDTGARVLLIHGFVQSLFDVGRLMQQCARSIPFGFVVLFVESLKTGDYRTSCSMGTNILENKAHPE